jgi:hypothetical protein
MAAVVHPSNERTLIELPLIDLRSQRSNYRPRPELAGKNGRSRRREDHALEKFSGFHLYRSYS